MHQRTADLLQRLSEVVLREMLQQDVAVDGVERVGAGETHREHAEVAL